MSINNLYKVTYQSGNYSFVGTLRNVKRFDLEQSVFFSVDGHSIFRGRIIGIELPPALNPEYKYKIEIDERVVDVLTNRAYYNITCNRIFSSFEEAEISALQNADKMFELEKGNIKAYFNQFRPKIDNE